MRSAHPAAPQRFHESSYKGSFKGSFEGSLERSYSIKVLMRVSMTKVAIMVRKAMRVL